MKKNASLIRLRGCLDSLKLVRKAVCSNTGKLIPDRDYLERIREGSEWSGQPTCNCKTCRAIKEKSKSGLLEDNGR